MDTPKLKDIVDYFNEAYYCGQPNPLIGNDTAKLTFFMMYFMSEQDCLIHGPSGGGKTTLLDGAVALFAGEEALEDRADGIIVASGGSSKSMITRSMESRLRRDHFFIMRELQTFIQDSTNMEMFKTWMEGKTFVYGRNNAGSDETDVYRFYNPCIATSIADENEKATKLGEELERRMYRIEIRSDNELNKRVHSAKAEIDALTPDKRFHLSLNEVEGLREHLQIASRKRYGKPPRVNNPLDKLKPKSDHKIKHIVNPCSPSIQSRIPTRSTRSNTMINYWFKAPRGVATFYWPECEGRFGDIMMCTPADNYHAWQMCGKSIVYSSMGINGTLGQSLLDMIHIRSYETDDDIASRDNSTHVDDIVRAMRVTADITKSVIIRNLSNLEMNGFIFSDDRHKYYWTYMEQQYKMGASWPDICEDTNAFVKENYPEHYDEYLPYVEDPVAEFWTKPDGDIVWEKVKILDVDDMSNKYSKAVEQENKKKIANLSDIESYFEK